MSAPPRKRFPLSLTQLDGASPRAVPASAARVLIKPQRHWQQAEAHARTTAPSGLGLDSSEVRLRMVQRLRAEGIEDERVLRAFAEVARHEFVDSALATQAYEDTALPIGLGQTISKPSVVARMLSLCLQGQLTQGAAPPWRQVLEIGTGCGYQAALLSRLSRRVVSVERLKPLHDKARGHLQQYTNVSVVYADGCAGYAASAPFDVIVAAAGGEELPEPWLQQLAPGGRLVAPLSLPGRGQALVVVDHVQQAGRSSYVRTVHESVLFVPLKSGVM
ncbi:protein-L-isoaspartate(D-aspartate) O-methyltransferase [Roseateles sp. BYS180W]|uniref:Protein-L-isoaspartate O-methyltransferase n=1 Tax=Roseateles rivi TaxID=3299028 RepID=A0ABW7FYE6_9BURK